MTILSQRDKRWKSITLGTSGTIGDFGCTITCLAMIIGSTPDVVNERLKAVNGYAQGNLVIWAKLEEAFPGIKIKRVWSYDNADVLKNVPNVLVEVDGKPIGGYRHWVVYVGNKKAYDPWTGTEVPTSQYPTPVSYCVIGGTWNKPSPVQDTVAVDKATFENLVRGSTIRDRVREKLNVEDSETVILAEIDKLIKYEDTVVEKEKQIIDAATKIATLEGQIKEFTTISENLKDANLILNQQVLDQKDVIQKQDVSIATMTRQLDDLKKMIKMPVFSGWKKQLVLFLSKI